MLKEPTFQIISNKEMRSVKSKHLYQRSEENLFLSTFDLLNILCSFTFSYKMKFIYFELNPY